MTDDADRLAAQFLGPEWRAVLEICRDDPSLKERVSASIASVLIDWLRDALRVDGRSGWPDIEDRVFAFDELPGTYPQADGVFQACFHPNLMPATLDEPTLRWMIRKMPARTTNLIAEEDQRNGSGSDLDKLQRAIDHYRGVVRNSTPALDEHWRFARIVVGGDVVSEGGGVGLGSPWVRDGARPRF